MAKKGEKWIQSALKPSTKGKLHAELGIKADKKIPAKALDKATHSKNPTIKKEAVLAKTLKGFHRNKG